MAIESKMNRGPIGARPGSPETKKFNSGKWIVGFFLLLIVIGGIWYFSQRGSPSAPPSGSSNEPLAIESGEYQAVFLDNGQVYFGKLQKTREAFYTLKDVFYLQSNMAVEQASNLSLTKLGSEAHGPEDWMQINTEHILFIEDMKNDSKVVQAIQDYKSKSKN
ncbi:DUF2905 domain-containing protein [Candidatus Uhrbacteria bacterium]|nr:DUF2905 domain-containing protein [Candidatus Uhrbacteria bacterium]